MAASPTFKRFITRNSYLPVIAAWLITLSFIIDNYWSGNASLESVRKNLQEYVQKQEKDFAGLLADTSALGKYSNSDFSENFLSDLAGKKYFIYRYFINDVGQSQLVLWSTQTVLPPDSLIQATAPAGFAHLSNGYYVWRRQQHDRLVQIALIPVKWQYVITNEYLKNTFATGSDIERNYDISDQPGPAVVRSAEGEPLFYLVKKAANILPRNNTVAIGFRVVGILFLLLFLHLCAGYISTRHSLLSGTLFLAAVLFTVRLISYYFSFPLNFRQFELFDPSVYGSTVVLRSLGDLLINVILLVWVILFVRQQVQDKKIIVHLHRPWLNRILVAAAALVFLVATFVSGNIIRSMVADSQISFDVINFFTLNIYSVVGFVVLCCIAIGYFSLSQLLVNLVRALLGGRFMLFYLMLAVGGLGYLTYQLNTGSAGFELLVFAWLLLYILLLTTRYFARVDISINSSQLIFWVLIFSVTITAIIVLENNRKELNRLRHYAENLADRTDPLNETLVNPLLTDFRNEFVADNFSRLEVDSSNRFIKDSLLNSNFSGYNNKYETRIYTFNAKEEPLFNNDSTSFNELVTVLNTQGRATSIPDLYYYDESYDRYNYIGRKVITNRDDSLMGYVFILASQKKNKTEKLSPELFFKGNDNAIENSAVYAFAVYNNLQLINSHNDYAFATRLTPQQLPKEPFTTNDKNGYVELWYKASPQKVVIIARENNFVIESITLFSYLFCAFLILAALFWLLNISIRAGFNRNRFRAQWQLSIRNQIHGTIILISVLSFFIIGIATILFFINRYENNNREKLSRTIHVMENEVRNSLNELSIFDDVVKVYDEGYREKLEQIIAKVSEIHAADINLYDLDGNLRASSLPLPYNKGIVSTKMDPLAYYHLSKLKEVQFFKDEKIGGLNFVSNYIPVIDATGREAVYLNIPYFTSQSKLKQEIANFLVTIINLNAFIFLIAGIISLFITNRITRSFSVISDKMKAINLGQMNEAIDWKRNDEIGELVKEYNKMVAKLDESAAILAKSEREGAWREMARQVAHEIKNPLTPMKLSLQYLQKSIGDNGANVKELTASVAQTLVEQIDHLTQIAGEFSQFANIGNPKNEVFDLHESIRPVIQLHATYENVQLEWLALPEPLMVFADKTHINRLFTNLILNAIQAVPKERMAHIRVSENREGDYVQVVISDNGAGIPEVMRSKIFTPNFTTKSSGTGLGLAMCKGIVEQAKGFISFTTEPGNGTNFYVKLPLQKPAES